MAFCTSCGSGLLADAQFCATCGRAVGPTAPAPGVVTPPTSWSPAGAPPLAPPQPPPGSVSGIGAPPPFAPQVWYPPTSGPTERPVSRALAVWLQVLLACTAATFLIAALAVVSVRAAADNYFGSNGVTNYASAHTWVDREDTAAAVIGFAGFLSIAVAVLMIIWAFQFTRAVGRHRPYGRRWTPGWAIGAWFIPLANYFLCPAILMEDEKIAMAAARGNTEGWKNERAHPLTVFWFGAWALGGIMSFVGNSAVHATRRLVLPSEHNVMTGYAVLIVATLVSASAATMAAICVRRMTRLDHGEAASASTQFAAAPVGSPSAPRPNWDL